MFSQVILEQTPFQESKQEVTKPVFSVKNGGKSTKSIDSS